jgi:hypothetical protein
MVDALVYGTIDYRLFGTGWCMVDALFMVQVDYRLRYRLMHG